MRAARIEIPMLPTRAMNPNGRAHWAVRRRDTEPFKQAIAIQTKRLRFQKVIITVTFVVRDKRRRDGDNFLASLKGAFDTLVHEGVVKDDSAEYVSYAPVVFVVDRERAPMTIIKLQEVGT